MREPHGSSQKEKIAHNQEHFHFYAFSTTAFKPAGIETLPKKRCLLTQVVLTNPRDYEWPLKLIIKQKLTVPWFPVLVLHGVFLERRPLNSTQCHLCWPTHTCEVRAPQHSGYPFPSALSCRCTKEDAPVVAEESELWHSMLLQVSVDETQILHSIKQGTPRMQPGLLPVDDFLGWYYPNIFREVHCRQFCCKEDACIGKE